MDNGELFKNRYLAVRSAMTKAKNPEFKELWRNIMTKLVQAESDRNGTLNRYFKEDDTV